MGKYCTMFAFDGVEDPHLLHCTHKYFPDESQVTLQQIISTLERYFSERPFLKFKAPFTKLHENFGKDGTYRVLEAESKEPFLLDLKAKLDELQPDNWPDYVPHVTVGRNTDSLNYDIRDYVVMSEGKVVWSAMEKQRLLVEEITSAFRPKLRKLKPL